MTSTKSTTKVLATHEMGFAREVADQVCFLDAGAVLDHGTAEQIFGGPQPQAFACPAPTSAATRSTPNT